MAESEHRSNMASSMTIAGDRARLDSFPARPSFGQTLAFVLFVLTCVIALPILKGFDAICSAIARPVIVWK